MGRFEQVRASVRRAYRVSRDALRAGRELSPNGRDPEAALPAPETLVLAPPAADGSAPPAGDSVAGRDDAEVPHALRIAAAWSWRLLLVAAAGAVVIWAVSRLQQIVIPLAISLLLSAMLAPAVGWLRRAVRLPRSLAVAVVLIGGLAAVVGVLTLVISQFVQGFPDLSEKATAGVREIQGWLHRPPLNLSNQQLDDAVRAVETWANENRRVLTSGAVATATTVLHVFASAFLVLFTTFFFLRDGRRIWLFVVRIVPGPARYSVARAGEASWSTLEAYVRATVLVAFIDAVGIGAALWALDVNFALPLAALVFLASFIPIVGATLSGSVAVLVALVDRGPFIALLVLAAVIFVQQLEGHVLQPLIMGRAVAIHPLAVIVAIATGVILAGIVGALVAVPLVAVLNTAIRRLGDEPGQPLPDAVVVSSEPHP